jgi:hypothetical protein
MDSLQSRAESKRTSTGVDPIAETHTAKYLMRKFKESGRSTIRYFEMLLVPSALGKSRDTRDAMSTPGIPGTKKEIAGSLTSSSARHANVRPGTRQTAHEPFLLHSVADDGHFKAGLVEPVRMAHFEFGCLDMQVVIPAGNHSGDRKAAISGQIRDFALPGTGEHIADLADSVLDDIVDLLKLHSGHVCGDVNRR